jgi:hypothetical protein
LRPCRSRVDDFSGAIDASRSTEAQQTEFVIDPDFYEDRTETSRRVLRAPHIHLRAIGKIEGAV